MEYVKTCINMITELQHVNKITHVHVDSNSFQSVYFLNESRRCHQNISCSNYTNELGHHEHCCRTVECNQTYNVYYTVPYIVTCYIMRRLVTLYDHSVHV